MIKKYARTYIYGGALALKERQQFIELLNKIAGQNEALDPPALEDVLELLGRLMRNPEGAAEVLRHIYAIYIWCAHLGHNEPPLLANGKLNTAALVLAKDVAFGFVKATGINGAFFSAMANL